MRKCLTWPQEAVQLQSGDVLLVHTDGLNEAMNFDDEPFGLDRVTESLVSSVQPGEAAEGIAKGILWQMRRFAGLQTRLDDLTLVVIKVL